MRFKHKLRVRIITYESLRHLLYDKEKTILSKKNHQNLCIEDDGDEQRIFFGPLGVCHQGSDAASTGYW